jgi:predicted nucleic acid-binding protein
VQQALPWLRSEAQITTPSAAVRGIGEDEADDLVLSTALSGAAAFLVTRDRPLQQIGTDHPYRHEIAWIS